MKCINSSLEKTTQETTQENLTSKLNDNQQQIINHIKENPNITRNELAEKNNITPDGVKYNLNKLVKNGIIERIGSIKAGCWKIKITKFYKKNAIFVHLVRKYQKKYVFFVRNVLKC